MTAAVTGEEHWAQKGEVSLFLWRKRVTGAATPAAPPVVLVHGSSLSSLPTFDLTVPGHPDYSFMDWLARRGHDVWTLDHEGYGRSTITAGSSDIATGVADLMAATDVIAKVTGAPQEGPAARAGEATQIRASCELLCLASRLRPICKS